jgi:hypothetical protein
MPDFRYVLIQPSTRNGFVTTAPDYPMAVSVSREWESNGPLKKPHVLTPIALSVVEGCAQSPRSNRARDMCSCWFYEHGHEHE